MSVNTGKLKERRKKLPKKKNDHSIDHIHKRYACTNYLFATICQNKNKSNVR
jgi:hypothetical protein